MKVLVTGATGFIGYHVIHYLLQKEFEIIATSSDYKKAKDKDWFNKVQFIGHNFNNASDENLFQKFSEPEILVHLAWEGLPNYKNAFHVEKVLPAQFAFLENMIRNGLNDMLVTGTCFEYGMKEGGLSESMPADPSNPYAEAKNQLRKRLESLQVTHSFSLKWVRLFYMYGKEQNPGSLLAQLDKAIESGDPIFNMSGGQQVRDYLPVETVAEFVVRIALQTKVTGIINCCSNDPITVEQLVRDHVKKRHANIQLNLGYYPYPEYEAMKFWGDDQKLKKALSEKPKKTNRATC